jgi:glycosyltransferase involved in cell wall biosynthesis
MRIAYFSPMPPAKTGIATYSSHLVPALAERFEITVFSPGECVWQAPANCRVVNFKADPFTLKSLGDYDQIVYHLGNNPWFHLDIYKIFLQFSGYVVLHDLVLYFLIAGLGRGGMIKEFCENYGPGRLQEVWDLITSCPEEDLLRYRNPERYPFLHRTVKRARGIIVHNRTSADQLVALGLADSVDVVPHLCYPEQTADRYGDAPVRKIRNKVGVGKDDVLIGIFGFIGPTKRIGQVLRAVKMFMTNNPETPVRILIVGEGDSLNGDIMASGLQDRVMQLGFVSNDQFATCLAAVDIVVNLRYPSMGESSGSLIQAMAFGKPVIVTNHAFFSELPDDVVAKVSHGSTEVADIVHALQRLIVDKGERRRMGSAARGYVENQCAPDKVSAAYLDVLGRGSPVIANRTANETPKSEIAPEWVLNYLMRRMVDVIPNTTDSRLDHIDRMRRCR